MREQNVDPETEGRLPVPSPSRYHYGDVVSGETVTGDYRVVIDGDVKPGGAVFARGGGATVVVMGNVYEGANVGAQGGAAKVVILGDLRRR